jgi:hypothetical protein
VGGAQFFEQFDASYFRHVVVREQQVIAVKLKDVPGDSAICGGIHLVAGASQHLDVEAADVTIVIHHENTLMI